MTMGGCDGPVPRQTHVKVVCPKAFLYSTTQHTPVQLDITKLGRELLLAVVMFCVCGHVACLSLPPLSSRPLPSLFIVHPQTNTKLAMGRSQCIRILPQPGVFTSPPSPFLSSSPPCPPLSSCPHPSLPIMHSQTSTTLGMGWGPVHTHTSTTRRRR